MHRPRIATLPSRRSTWFWIVLLGALSGVARADEGAALMRTTMIVSDLDRTLSFYQSLGFAIESDHGGPRKPDAAFPVAAPSSRFRLVILGSRDAGSGRIGLLQFADPSPPRMVAPRAHVGIGDTVLVIRVPDGLAVFDHFKTAGVRLVEQTPEPYRMQRPDGSISAGHLFHAYDPDGRLIEILTPQPPPANSSGNPSGKPPGRAP
jgi:catechol 2,3-dioxygenase-like lactoylglutathione lyase family enzyme